MVSNGQFASSVSLDFQDILRSVKQIHWKGILRINAPNTNKKNTKKTKGQQTIKFRDKKKDGIYGIEVYKFDQETSRRAWAEA